MIPPGERSTAALKRATSSSDICIRLRLLARSTTEFTRSSQPGGGMRRRNKNTVKTKSTDSRESDTDETLAYYSEKERRTRICWLTECFKKLSRGKPSIKEQCVIDGIIGPTHTDQKDVHAACGHRKRDNAIVIYTFQCLWHYTRNIKGR